MTDIGEMPGSRGPLYTEAEASGRWCPAARVVGRFVATSPGGKHHADASVKGTYNRLPDGQPAKGTHCIGSACPKFHWAEPLRIHGTDKPDLRRRGFCALGSHTRPEIE